MAINQPQIKLMSKFLFRNISIRNMEYSYATHLNNRRRDGFTILITSFYIPFQVDVEEFEYEVELLICMHDIKKTKFMTKGVEHELKSH